MESHVRVGRRDVKVTNPDKLIFPESGITKGDLIDYYIAIGDAMFPEVADRLITMERYPDGIDGKVFWQKDISKYFPDWIERKTVPKKGGTVTHVVVNEKAVLAYLGNQASITIHMSLAKQDQVDHPDQLIIDLDPSVDDFAQVRRAALDLRSLLDDLKLHSVVKSTGSRGLHVTVPLDRTASFDEVRVFARDLAEYMVSQDPDGLTIEARKENRGDRIYVDWIRNSLSATAVAPFSVRARPGAPVAMPLDWSEVEDRTLRPDRYSMKNAVKEVANGHAPWKGWRRRARSLKDPIRRLAALSEEP